MPRSYTCDGYSWLCVEPQGHRPGDGGERPPCPVLGTVDLLAAPGFTDGIRPRPLCLAHFTQGDDSEAQHVVATVSACPKGIFLMRERQYFLLAQKVGWI